MIFITGIPSAGKTTLATKLGAYLGLPVFITDDVYYLIARHLGMTEDEIREFANPNVWQTVEDIANLKARFYKEFLSQVPPHAILEGYGLCFEEDRQAIGIEPEACFFLEVSYEDWVRCHKTAYTPETKQEYDRLVSLVSLPKGTYRIDQNTNLCTPDDKVYTGLSPDFVERKFQTLKLDNLEGKSVLDLGGNNGEISRLCLEAGAKSALVVDCNWRHLQRARDLEKQVFDLNRIESFPGQYDVVLSVSMLHYIPDQEKFIRECSRLAKEMFLLEVPVLQEAGLKAGWDNPEGTIKPTEELVLKWLHRYFPRVEKVGQSVPPDKSYRPIFKAYK